MSASFASQSRSKRRSTDLPGFTGRTDRLGSSRSAKRQQPSIELDSRDPKRKRSRRSQGSSVPSQKIGDNKPNERQLQLAADTSVEMVDVDTPVSPVKVESTEIEAVKIATLTDLPVELLLHIHEISGSSELPCVSRYTWFALKSTTSIHAIRWLLNRYSEQGGEKFLSLALRHPVCNFDLLRTIEKAWKENWNTMGETDPEISPAAQILRPFFKASNQAFLPCLNAPRRIYRIPPSETMGQGADPMSPLARYVTERFIVPAKTLDYGVRHAVYTDQIELARTLVGFGGSPFSGDGLALEIALRRKNLDMIRAIVGSDEGPRPSGLHRPEIRALIVKFANREILSFFVEERGVKLSLGSILAL